MCRPLLARLIVDDHVTVDGTVLNDGQAEIADTDASNGVVHVIDGVLLPE